MRNAIRGVAMSFVVVLASCGGQAPGTVESKSDALAACTAATPAVSSALVDGGDCMQCCTYTQGYWKNHLDWPVSGLTIGSHTYTNSELLTILNTPVAGNGLVALAHQLIAAMLNVAKGDCPTPCPVIQSIALVGDLDLRTDHLAPRITSPYVNALTAYNEQNHCAD